MQAVRDFLDSGIQSFLEFGDRVAFAACDNAAKDAVKRGEGVFTARRHLADELFKTSGAPDQLFRMFDVGKMVIRGCKRDIKARSDYIDFFVCRDFETHKPILWGRDHVGRFYIAVCYDRGSSTHVACLFQRYSDDPFFFVNSVDDIAKRVCTSNFQEGRRIDSLDSHHLNLLTLATEGTLVLEAGEVVRVHSV